MCILTSTHDRSENIQSRNHNSEKLISFVEKSIILSLESTVAMIARFLHFKLYRFVPFLSRSTIIKLRLAKRLFAVQRKGKVAREIDDASENTQCSVVVSGEAMRRNQEMSFQMQGQNPNTCENLI